MAEAVFLVFGPRHRPLDTAAFGKIDAAEKRPRRERLPPIQARREKVTEAPRKVQPRLRWDPLRTRQCGIAAPADFEAAEEVSLGARHAVKDRRAKPDVAEDLGIGMKSQSRPAPIVYRPAVDDPALRNAAAVALAP